MKITGSKILLTAILAFNFAYSQVANTSTNLNLDPSKSSSEILNNNSQENKVNPNQATQNNTSLKTDLNTGLNNNITNTETNAGISSTSISSEENNQANLKNTEDSQKNFTQKLYDSVKKYVENSKEWLLSLFESTGSSSIRFLIVFLIGVLLALTPCIYPMIPITIGILQTNQTKSPVRGFLLALAYTFGISTTFAIFGFIATLTTSIFGEFQGSPWLVIPVVLFLFYFGFSMLGAYEIHIPKFLRPKNHNVKGGSLFSAYIFGAISGTIASPCLSSGLIFVLNYVTTLSATGTLWGYIEGLLLLFVFGIGSSLPLLIIGTFSTSLNLLPKAGMWMLEINKLIGLLLIGAGFYQLSHLTSLIPWHILIFVIAAFLLLIAIYYFLSINNTDSSFTKLYKALVSLIFILGASYTFTRAIQEFYKPNSFSSSQAHSNYWLNSYQEALLKAKQEHKNLFIDIGASYCGACKELDRDIFSKPAVEKALTELYVPLKAEADGAEETYNEIKNLFGTYIKGFPTYLIVSPEDLKVIQNWYVEIEDLTIDQFVNKLKELAK